MEKYQNYINGNWLDPHSNEWFENINPATGESIGRFPSSRSEDIDIAVSSAKRAQKLWKKIPGPERADYLLKAADFLALHKDTFAKQLCLEMGKVITECQGDIQETIDIAIFTAGEGRRSLGFTTNSEMKNRHVYAIRSPIGVVGAITPWNYPMAMPAWKIMPALVTGNSVVLKPAEDTPLSAINLVKAFEFAGLPEGVLNLIIGLGETKKLKVGNGMDQAVDIGPIINESHLDEIYTDVLNSVKQGAKLLYGGSILTKINNASGYFYQPTILVDVMPHMEIAQKEIFGPVAVIMKAKDFSHALDTANDVNYSLTAGIFTNNINKIMSFIDDIEAGSVFINTACVGAEIQIPFGGMKGSGNGHREGAHQMLDIYTEWKSVSMQQI